VGKTGRLFPVLEKQAKKGKAKNGEVKSLRIRLFPGKELDWVKQVHDQSRWMYNAALSICYQHFKDVSALKSVSETSLRDLVKHYRYEVEEEVLSTGQTIQYKEFKYDSSYEGWPTLPDQTILHNRIARGAVMSFARALNAGLSNLKAGNIRNFQMGYKSKKHSPIYTTFFEDKSFPVAFKTMKSMYCYTTKCKGGNRRTFTTFQDILKEDTSPGGFVLEYDRLTNKHYILYTVPADWFPSNDRRRDSQTLAMEKKDSSLISLDPGVRTFLTGYDPDGNIISIGEAANQELYSMLEYADKLKSDNSPELEVQRINRKIRNVCRDLHWKASKYLASTYNIVILPHFRTAEMLRGKKLSKRTKRQMQAFSFFQFKEKLAFQCKKYGSHLVLVEEDYTSKTCGACGQVKWNLKGEKLFKCDSCLYESDRDENGARNILLKNLRGVLA
jgi:IS605 OrfB family transposase